jgi:hypothetical protein
MRASIAAWTVAGAVVLVVGLYTTYLWEAGQSLLIVDSGRLAREARSELEEHRPDVAALLAAKALPATVSGITLQRRWNPEAEEALHEALQFGAGMRRFPMLSPVEEGWNARAVAAFAAEDKVYVLRRAAGASPGFREGVKYALEAFDAKTGKPSPGDESGDAYPLKTLPAPEYRSLQPLRRRDVFAVSPSADAFVTGEAYVSLEGETGVAGCLFEIDQSAGSVSLAAAFDMRLPTGSRWPTRPAAALGDAASSGEARSRMLLVETTSGPAYTVLTNQNAQTVGCDGGVNPSDAANGELHPGRQPVDQAALFERSPLATLVRRGPFAFVSAVANPQDRGVGSFSPFQLDADTLVPVGPMAATPDLSRLIFGAAKTDDPEEAIAYYAASIDRNGTAKVTRLEYGANSDASALAVSPDGSAGFIAVEDRLTEFDLSTFKPRKTLSFRDSPRISALKALSNTELAITLGSFGDASTEIRSLPLQEGGVMRRIDHDGVEPLQIAPSTSGELLLFLGRSGDFEIWNARTGALLHASADLFANRFLIFGVASLAPAPASWSGVKGAESVQLVTEYGEAFSLPQSEFRLRISAPIEGAGGEYPSLASEKSPRFYNRGFISDIDGRGADIAVATHLLAPTPTAGDGFRLQASPPAILGLSAGEVRPLLDSETADLETAVFVRRLRGDLLAALTWDAAVLEEMDASGSPERAPCGTTPQPRHCRGLRLAFWRDGLRVGPAEMIAPGAPIFDVKPLLVASEGRRFLAAGDGRGEVAVYRVLSKDKDNRAAQKLWSFDRTAACEEDGAENAISHVYLRELSVRFGRPTRIGVIVVCDLDGAVRYFDAPVSEKATIKFDKSVYAGGYEPKVRFDAKSGRLFVWGADPKQLDILQFPAEGANRPVVTTLKIRQTTTDDPSTEGVDEASVPSAIDGVWASAAADAGFYVAFESGRLQRCSTAAGSPGTCESLDQVGAGGGGYRTPIALVYDGFDECSGDVKQATRVLVADARDLRLITLPDKRVSWTRRMEKGEFNRYGMGGSPAPIVFENRARDEMVFAAAMRSNEVFVHSFPRPRCSLPTNALDRLLEAGRSLSEADRARFETDSYLSFPVWMGLKAKGVAAWFCNKFPGAPFCSQKDEAEKAGP